MISQQDKTFLENATKNLPKDAVLESSDPFFQQLQQIKEARRKGNKGKGVTGGAHLADTGHGLKPTAGMKGVKEGEEEERRVWNVNVDESSFKLNPKKKGMFKGKSLSSIEKSAKHDTGTKKKEDVFAINAKHHFKKGVKEDLQGDKFDESKPMFASKGNALDAAQQGWGKKTTGPTRVRPQASPDGSAEQGHGKKAVTGELQRKEDVQTETQIDEISADSAQKYFKASSADVKNRAASPIDKKYGRKQQNRMVGMARSLTRSYDITRKHIPAYNKEELELDESTRKHFREVANTVRAIDNPKKRQEFADHHAAIFSSQNPKFDPERFHEAAGTLYRKEDINMNEDGDAKGQGTHPTGKEKLGPDGTNHAGSPEAQGHGGAAVQGHGKKPVRGEIATGMHPGSPEAQGAGGAAVQGHGKKPVLGVICREDVQELITHILEDKPGEAMEALSTALAPMLQQAVAARKEEIQGSMLGDVVAEDEGSEVEVDVAAEKGQVEKKVDENEEV